MALRIDKISPVAAVAGTTEVVITGEGFGDTQGTSTLKVGGIAVTGIPDADWNATDITFVPTVTTTPLGAQDVEIVVSGVKATAEKSLYIRDETERFDADEVVGGMIYRVYIDGIHAGFCDGEVTLGTEDTVLDFKPNNLRSPVKSLVTSRVGSVGFTLAQQNGTNLGIALGGAWDAPTKRMSVTGSRTVSEHSVLFEDKDDSDGSVRNSYFVPRCQVITPAKITLNPDQLFMLPVTLRALAVDNDTGLIFRSELP